MHRAQLASARCWRLEKMNAPPERTGRRDADHGARSERTRDDTRRTDAGNQRWNNSAAAARAGTDAHARGDARCASQREWCVPPTRTRSQPRRSERRRMSSRRSCSPHRLNTDHVILREEMCLLDDGGGESRAEHGSRHFCARRCACSPKGEEENDVARAEHGSGQFCARRCPCWTRTFPHWGTIRHRRTFGPSTRRARRE